MNIEHFLYEFNEEGKIVISFEMLSQIHTIELTEKDLKRMLHIIELFTNSN